MDRWIKVLVDGWMDGSMDGWIDGWMDGWMGRSVDKLTIAGIDIETYIYIRIQI